MRGRDREIAKDEAKPIAHPRLYLFDDGVRGTAVGALVVAVLDERHGRIRRTLNMVAALCDRHRQQRRPLGRAHGPPSFARPSRARRMPSAPGLIPTGETKLHCTIPSPSMTN